MNALDAVRATVQAYPGGAEALAPRMGLTGAVLRAKLNASDRNHFYLVEAEALLGLTDDHRLLHAMASNAGYALHPVAEAQADDASVLELVLAMGTTGGELSRVICEALADNVITKNEMAAISRASHDDQAALLRLVSRLCEMASREPK